MPTRWRRELSCTVNDWPTARLAGMLPALVIVKSPASAVAMPDRWRSETAAPRVSAADAGVGDLHRLGRACSRAAVAGGDRAEGHERRAGGQLRARRRRTQQRDAIGAKFGDVDVSRRRILDQIDRIAETRETGNGAIDGDNVVIGIGRQNGNVIPRAILGDEHLPIEHPAKGVALILNDAIGRVVRAEVEIRSRDNWRRDCVPTG